MPREPLGLIPPHEFPSHWQPVRELGRGGMGRVFEVRHPSGRLAALKLVEQADSPELLERFDFEARIMAGLRHPALLQVLDIGRVGHRPAIVLEKMAGSLSDRLRREGPLDWREALELIAPVAEGLEHAHSHGILHRDIKPANILLDDVGAPRLADFGLARLSANARSLTESGVILGTPKTMAPEQIETPRLIDARADIYALGATLYEVLGGVPVVRGKTVLEVCQKVLTDSPIPINERVDGLPDGLNELVMACLAKDRADRPQTAGEVADACRRLLQGHPLGELSSDQHLAAGPARPASRGLAMPIGLLGLVAMTGVAGWLAAERHRMQDLVAAERTAKARLADRARSSDERVKALNIALDINKTRSRLNRRVEAARLNALRRIDRERVEQQLHEARAALGAAHPARAHRLASDGLRLWREADKRGSPLPAVGRRAFEDVRTAAAASSPFIRRIPARLGTTVSALAFSPDGDHLGAAAGDTFVVWELERGELALKRRVDAGAVQELRVGSGGRSLSARTPAAALHFGPGGAISTLPVSGRHASLALDGRALIAQPKGTETLELRRFDGPTTKPIVINGVGRVTGLAAVKDGWLVSVRDDRATRVRKVASYGKLTDELALPTLPTGCRLVAASANSEALLLITEDAEPLFVAGDRATSLRRRLRPEHFPTARFDRLGKRLVVSGDPTPQVLQRMKSGDIRTLPVPSSSRRAAALNVAIAGDGLMIATAELGGAVSVQRGAAEYSAYKEAFELRGLPEPGPTQRLQARWLDNERFVVVDHRGEQRVMTIEGTTKRGRAASTPDDPPVLVRSIRDTVTLVTRSGLILEGEGRFRPASPAVDRPIRDLVYLPGQTFALLNSLGQVSMLDRKSGALRRVLEGDPPGARGVFLATREDLLLVGHADGRITGIRPGESFEIRPAGSPDGSVPRGLMRFRSFAGGRVIAVFSADTGQIELRLPNGTTARGHIKGLRDLALVGRNPYQLISLDSEGRIAFHTLPSFVEYLSYPGMASFQRLELSPNGRALLAVGREIAVMDVTLARNLAVEFDAGLPLSRLSLRQAKDSAVLSVVGVGDEGVSIIELSMKRSFLQSAGGARRTTAPGPDGRLLQLGPIESGDARVELLQLTGREVRSLAETRIPISGSPVGPVEGQGGEFALGAGKVLHVWSTVGPTPTLEAAVIRLESSVTAIAAATRPSGGFTVATKDGRLHFVQKGVPKAHAVTALDGLHVSALSFEDPSRPRLLGTTRGEVIDWNFDHRKTRLAPSAGPPIGALVHSSESGFYALARGPTLEIRSLLDDRLWMLRRFARPIADLHLTGELLCVGREDGRILVIPASRLKDYATRRVELADPLSLRASQP